MVFPKIIFIIGMHRCGTSLLARCLFNNNFSIGENKNTDKDWQNPNGYFENDTFTNFHNKLLSFNNSCWLNINNLPMKYTQEHIEEYRQLLKTEFQNDQLLLIKDPRLTFFVDFLKEVCNGNYKHYFIFLTRNKDECCQSLSSAQNISLIESQNLFDITMNLYRNDYLKINHNDIIYNNDTVLSIISDYIQMNLKKTSNLVNIELYRHRNK